MMTAIVSSSVITSSSCGTETLQVGYDDDRLGLYPELPVDFAAIAGRCAASSGEKAPPPGLSPRGSLDLVRPLVVGRWFVCPGSPPPKATSFPDAFELTPKAVFTLTDPGQDHIVVRGDTMEPYEMAWSLTDGSFVVRFRGETFVVAFERNPMRMSVELDGMTWRFAKG